MSDTESMDMLLPETERKTSYLGSSLLFTLSSIVTLFFSLRDFARETSFANAGTVLANLLYVLGYGWYMYECFKDSKKDKDGDKGKGRALPIYLNRPIHVPF